MVLHRRMSTTMSTVRKPKSTLPLYAVLSRGSFTGSISIEHSNGHKSQVNLLLLRSYSWKMFTNRLSWKGLNSVEAPEYGSSLPLANPYIRIAGMCYLIHL